MLSLLAKVVLKPLPRQAIRKVKSEIPVLNTPLFLLELCVSRPCKSSQENCVDQTSSGGDIGTFPPNIQKGIDVGSEDERIECREACQEMTSNEGQASKACENASLQTCK
jgi:hypothetical protein